jgi:hypothetical protein
MKCLNFICEDHDPDARRNCGKDALGNAYPQYCNARKRYNRIMDDSARKGRDFRTLNERFNVELLRFVFLRDKY